MLSPDMNMGEFIATLIVLVLLTAVCYLAFPIIKIIINHGRFERKRAKKIALWNSIVVGACFFILTLAFDPGSVWNAAPAFLYYCISKSILTNKKTKNGLAPDPQDESPVEVLAEEQLSTEETHEEFVVTNDNPPDSVSPPNPVIGSSHPTSNPKTRYCSHCGGPIDPITKKCTSCEKQYFKLGKLFNYKTTLPIILSALLLTSLILNVFLAVGGRDKQDDIVPEINQTVGSQVQTKAKSKKANQTNGAQLIALTNQLNFYEKYVVFVSDDGTNRYHKYGCSKFDDSCFWAFNKETAISKGYTACPLCQ